MGAKSRQADPLFLFHEATGAFVVAYQDSDTIAAFKVDARTGCLTPFGKKLRTRSPTCIQISAGKLAQAIGRVHGND